MLCCVVLAAYDKSRIFFRENLLAFLSTLSLSFVEARDVIRYFTEQFYTKIKFFTSTFSIVAWSRFVALLTRVITASA